MHSSPLLGLACAAALVAGGCAAKTAPPAGPIGPPAPGTTATATATATSAPATAAVRTIAISVRGRTIVPKPSSVSIKKGETLRVVVTTGRDDRLHAHGFGLEKPLLAGQPTTVDLVGAEPGQYEIETHDPALLLLIVQVR